MATSCRTTRTGTHWTNTRGPVLSCLRLPRTTYVRVSGFGGVWTMFSRNGRRGFWRRSVSIIKDGLGKMLDFFLLAYKMTAARHSIIQVKKCLNVRQKLGTWKFFNVFLCFPMFSNVFQCYLLSFSLSLSLTISLSHSLTLSHSHTLSISHWITLDMLNNFCFHYSILKFDRTF